MRQSKFVKALDPLLALPMFTVADAKERGISSGIFEIPRLAEIIRQRSRVATTLP